MKENFSSPLETEPKLREFKTADGGKIVIPSSTEEHLLAHPEVQELLAEAISKISLPEGSMLITEVNMDRILGRSACVETPICAMDEKIMFAQRIHRAGPTRVITNVEGPETTVVSILAAPQKNQAKTYALLTAWIGPLAPMEPWDAKIAEGKFRESLDFWRSHALIWDKEVMSEPFESTWEEVLKNYKTIY